MRPCQDCGVDISKRGNAAKLCESCARERKVRWRMSREKARCRAANRGRLKELSEFIARCKASGAISSVSVEERREAARLKANRAFWARSRNLSRLRGHRREGDIV